MESFDEEYSYSIVFQLLSKRTNNY